MKNKLTKAILNFILIISILLIVMYFSLRENYEMIINQLRSFNIIWLFVALLLMFGYWTFKALCLFETTRLVNKDIKFLRCLNIIIITGFFNGITPFSSGGQPGQIYLMNKEGIKVSTATNISLQNFILYQVILVLFGVFAFVWNYYFHIFKDSAILENLIMLGFIANASVLIILFILSFCKKINVYIINFWVNLLYKLKLIKDIEKRKNEINITVNNFYKSAYLLNNNKIVLLKGLVYNLLGLICLYLTPVIIFYGFNNYHDLSVINGIVTAAYVMILGAFVPIPGGSGGLEYAFTSLFINFETSVFVTSAMIVWRFVTYYFDLILGGLCLAFYKKGVKK